MNGIFYGFLLKDLVIKGVGHGPTLLLLELFETLVCCCQYTFISIDFLFISMLGIFIRIRALLVYRQVNYP